MIRYNKCVYRGELARGRGVTLRTVELLNSPALLAFCRHTVEEVLASGASVLHSVLHFSIVAQLRWNSAHFTSRPVRHEK